MAQSPQQEPFLGRLLGTLAARYARFVCATSTITYDPPDARPLAAELHPFIFAMWHGQFVLMPTLHRGDFAVSAMVARHKDAAGVRVLLRDFDISVVRGAGAGQRKRDRGGASALRISLRLLEEGSTLAMTADIPPGPARRAGIGIVTLAKHSGRPIVPFAVATSRFIAFNTWSRMTLNLPFSKLVYVLGDPIWVPADATEDLMEERRQNVEAALNEVTQRAYRTVGGDIRRIAPPVAPAAPTGPEPIGFFLKSYRAGTNLLRAGAPLLLSVRSRQGKEDPERRGERYGEASLPRPPGPLAWFHAASVGETNAVLPVIERLLSEREDLSVLLTTGTLTSAALAKRRLPARAAHQFIVLDVSRYVQAFLDHWKPDIGVFAESEIWPNLIIEAERRGVSLALVNARMSARSAKRWSRFKGVARPLFSRFETILAQNAPIGRLFRTLGARHVEVLGNLKIDAPPPVVDAAALEALRRALAGRPVFVAASTHDPEEQTIRDAHAMAARRIPGLCTIIAPRHPDRGQAIAEMLAVKGFNVRRRSLGELPDAATDIYIADTIGELGTLYALTKVAFVGGSLISRGGQNPIEAIGHGAAVLTGPHWTNFRDFYRALIRHKAVREVKSPAEIAEAVEALLTDDTALDAARKGAAAALASLAGALDRTVAALADLLPARSGVRRAS